MWTWPALILAPLVALGQQSVLYALVPPACNGRPIGLLHVIALACVVACAAMTLMAWRERRAQAREARDAAGERRTTLGSIAVMMGVFSTFVSVALWVPVWVLSPCVQ